MFVVDMEIVQIVMEYVSVNGDGKEYLIVVNVYLVFLEKIVQLLYYL